MDVKALVEQGDLLFSKRMSLMSLWQDVAEQFYPERADFTVHRSLGNEFADNLTTSYPLLVRRDLGNALGTMMRPTSINWFAMRTEDEDREDQPSKQWLEWSTARMKREMYKRTSMFTRASKEGDHDIAAFGQCVKSVEMNRDATGLLYRCWHLRDNAWCENAEGVIDTNHRKWKPTPNPWPIMSSSVSRDVSHIDHPTTGAPRWTSWSGWMSNGGANDKTTS